MEAMPPARGASSSQYLSRMISRFALLMGAPGVLSRSHSRSRAAACKPEAAPSEARKSPGGLACIILILLCDFKLLWLPPRAGARARPPRREGPGGVVPVIDARRLVTPQRRAHHRRDPRRARRRLPQQLREHRPHLGHRDGRRFFPPAAAAPAAGTTGPAATAPCGGASPPTSAPPTAPALPPPCPPPTAPRPGAAPRAPAPPPRAAPGARCSGRTTSAVASRRCAAPPTARAAPPGRPPPSPARPPAAP